MQIKINLKIFIFLFLFYLTRQIEVYALIMLFALIHEMGHLIAGLILGLKPQKINIMPLGFSIMFEEYKSIERLNIKKSMIAIAGPITNLIIILLTFVLQVYISDYIAEMIIYANLLICIFNLLPIYPLDGGRIINSILNIRVGLKESMIITNKVSNIVIVLLTILASILILYIQNLAVFFIICYLWILVLRENKIVNLKIKMYDAIEMKNAN